MRFALHILGTEVLAISTDETAYDNGPGDTTTTPLGFSFTTPALTAGRYGFDDIEGER